MPHYYAGEDSNSLFLFLILENVTKSVAFYARTNRDPFDVGSENIVILNDVITNVGNAYDPNTGVFRTPYNGTIASLPVSLSCWRWYFPFSVPRLFDWPDDCLLWCCCSE